MKEITAQLKYSFSRINFLICAIENNEEKKLLHIGKPFYKTIQESINIWQKEMIEEQKIIEIYIVKYNLNIQEK